jgi:pimeloyl-ACP methyl ester carboxylesterase
MKSVTAGGHRLEYAWEGPGPEEAPTLVFLHEGLGCVSSWRDFPGEVARETGMGAIVYSRWGYGGSDPVTLPRPLGYMHDEAGTLPEVLDALGVRRAVLVGHSDGASIALIHAGGSREARVRGLVLLAPHVFVEDVSVASIAAARDAYQHGDLRARLARRHGANVDGAFRGWNDAWLDPAFRAWNIEEYLPGVGVPSLVVQGADDEYGTLAQVDAIAAKSAGAVTRLVLGGCKHAPHRERPAETRAAIAKHVRALDLR